jgi:hypothetical protein
MRQDGVSFSLHFDFPQIPFPVLATFAPILQLYETSPSSHPCQTSKQTASPCALYPPATRQIPPLLGAHAAPHLRLLGCTQRTCDGAKKQSWLLRCPCVTRTALLSISLISLHPVHLINLMAVSRLCMWKHVETRPSAALMLRQRRQSAATAGNHASVHLA